MSFALSPDGSQVAFVAEGKLWSRPLASVEARPFQDSGGAHDPFWSPDGRSVGYFKQSALWIAGLGGGESRMLCPAWNAMGGSWGVDDTILFAADFGRTIYRVPAGGGERTAIRTQGVHGTDLRWPAFVPGSSAFIYSARRAADQPRLIMAGRLEGDGGDRVLLESDANAQVAGDQLLFVRHGRLFAQRFDTRTLRVSGQARQVAGRIGSNLYNREDYANFSAAGPGVSMLAYLGARQIDRAAGAGRSHRCDHAADRAGRVPRHRDVAGRRFAGLRAARRSRGHARHLDARPGAHAANAHHVRCGRRPRAGVVARWPFHLLRIEPRQSVGDLSPRRRRHRRRRGGHGRLPASRAVRRLVGRPAGVHPPGSAARQRRVGGAAGAAGRPETVPRLDLARERAAVLTRWALDRLLDHRHRRSARLHRAPRRRRGRAGRSRSRTGASRSGAAMARSSTTTGPIAG